MPSYDFIEIGTSDFDTLVEKAKNETFGISIEPIKEYINKLPDKKNVLKLNIALSNKDGMTNVYYIPSEIIKKNNFPDWIRGCNSIGSPHITVVNLLKSYNLNPIDYIKTYEIETMSFQSLIKKYNVESIKYLKIDTEGHDCIILNNYIEYCTKNPQLFAQKITFETNVLTSREDQDEVIYKLVENGYTIQEKGHDTTLILQK